MTTRAKRILPSRGVDPPGLSAPQARNGPKSFAARSTFCTIEPPDPTERLACARTEGDPEGTPPLGSSDAAARNFVDRALPRGLEGMKSAKHLEFVHHERKR